MKSLDNSIYTAINNAGIAFDSTLNDQLKAQHELDRLAEEDGSRLSRADRAQIVRALKKAQFPDFDYAQNIRSVRDALIGALVLDQTVIIAWKRNNVLHFFGEDFILCSDDTDPLICKGIFFETLEIMRRCGFHVEKKMGEAEFKVKVK